MDLKELSNIYYSNSWHVRASYSNSWHELLGAVRSILGAVRSILGAVRSIYWALLGEGF